MPSRDVEPLLVSRLARSDRPPPRRPREAAPRPWVRRLAVALVVGTAAAVLLYQFAALASRPARAIQRHTREARLLDAQLAELQAQRAALEDRIAHLRTPLGIEEEARRQGWVREGEIALQVIQPEPEPATILLEPPEEAAPDAPLPDGPRAFWDRARELVSLTWLSVVGGDEQ